MAKARKATPTFECLVVKAGRILHQCRYADQALQVAESYGGSRRGTHVFVLGDNYARRFSEAQSRMTGGK